VARLLSEAGWQGHPGYAEVPAARPVFVTGLPRTGTTALHRLLVADPAHQGLELWLAGLAADAMRALAAGSEGRGPRPGHRYDLADFGLSGAEVDERFAGLPGYEPSKR
jgi:Sulfotransferase family